LDNHRSSQKNKWEGHEFTRATKIRDLRLRAAEVSLRVRVESWQICRREYMADEQTSAAEGVIFQLFRHD